MTTSEGFLTNLRTAEIFFRYCKRFKVNEVKDRLFVMRRLAAKKKAKYLRDPKAFIAGKNVAEIKIKKDTDNGQSR